MFSYAEGGGMVGRGEEKRGGEGMEGEERRPLTLAVPSLLVAGFLAWVSCD